MATSLVPDELWEIIEPQLPPEQPKRKGGAPRKPDRACLGGIIFVLRSGIPWEMLPQEMGFGSGMTCLRRLRDCYAAGVWKRLPAGNAQSVARAFLRLGCCLICFKHLERGFC